MKKTVSFLVAAALVFFLGGFVQAQDQTPPPPKPVVTAAAPTSPVPPTQAVPHPAKPVSTPHKAPVAETSPSAAVPAPAHPAPGLTPHAVSTSPALPAAIAQAPLPIPTAPTTAEAAIPHPADIAVTPHPAAPVAAALAMSASTSISVPAAPGAPVALAVEQTPPSRETVATEAQAATKPKPSAPKPSAPTPHAPAEMRTEIIKFNFLDAITVHSLLSNYRSQYGRISNIVDRATKSIVVTDTPEIVEKMISIIKEIDVKPVEIQFTVQLIQGMEAEGPGDESLKNDPVIRELRSVLKYKSFALLDGTIMRVIDGNEAETKFGPKGEYAIRLEPKYVKEGATETIQTRIQLRKPEWISQRTTKQETKEEIQSQQMYFNELIGTTLQLKVGEKTVVGVSKSDADKGLILILSAKVIK